MFIYTDTGGRTFLEEKQGIFNVVPEAGLEPARPVTGPGF